MIQNIYSASRSQLIRLVHHLIFWPCRLVPTQQASSHLLLRWTARFARTDFLLPTCHPSRTRLLTALSGTIPTRSVTVLSNPQCIVQGLRLAIRFSSMNGPVGRAGVMTGVARGTGQPVTQLGRFLCPDQSLDENKIK